MSDQGLYEMRITAVGEVRDAEGNVVETRPIEAVATLTAEQVRTLTEGETP